MDGNAEMCEISSRSTQFTKAQLAELVTESYRKLYPSNDVAEGNKISNHEGNF